MQEGAMARHLAAGPGWAGSMQPWHLALPAVSNSTTHMACMCALRSCHPAGPDAWKPGTQEPDDGVTLRETW